MRTPTRAACVVATTALLVAGTSSAAQAADKDESAPLGARGHSSYQSGHTLAAGDCGVRVDLPHPSYTTANQIHTRVESFCQGSTIVNNTITGKSYRSRWYGWEHMKTKSAGPKTAWRVRVTVDVNCDYGTLHRWRTEGYGSGILDGQPVSASAYEENDDEIQCGANN
ncbi:hypothetical protein AB0H28_18585 [Micromonospora sp. NPDC050980]|uniref:hypothetical protein n=1 Tax=Micromonospora sp. NPDC050980 TaxID=3155161 RepID=UPI00340CDC4A